MPKTRLSLAVPMALAFASAALAADASPPTLHRYAETDRAYGANAYWLESAEGIVLVDALFLKPDAELLATLLASRGKPVAGVILTHPHVDHFGGLAALRDRFPGLPVYATAGVAAAVRGVHERAYADGWIQAFGADYDERVVVPDRVVESGVTLELAGMRFRIVAFGAMESAENLVVHNLDLDLVFPGDAMVNGAVYYLGEGHSAGAAGGLERIDAAFPGPRVVLPGHGDPGELHALVADNLEQVRGMRRDVERALADRRQRTETGALRDQARARLVGAFAERLRGRLSYGLPVEVIAQLNVAGIERELVGETKP